MLIETCIRCEYGEQRSDSSYCLKEGYFSYLTKCIQNKALERYVCETCGKDVDTRETVVPGSKLS